MNTVKELIVWAYGKSIERGRWLPRSGGCPSAREQVNQEQKGE